MTRDSTDKIHRLHQQLSQELTKKADPELKKKMQHYFKNEIKAYGFKSADLKAIAKKYWKEPISKMEKEECFSLFEKMLQTDYFEEAYLVTDWLPKLHKQFAKEDLAILKNWVDQYINNWAKCDGFCAHTMRRYLTKFPEEKDAVKAWKDHQNIWMKRAAAVSFIPFARKGIYLDDAFEIAETLMLHPHDMVQKGYGWLLKEASKADQQRVFNYVLQNKDKMPRTALRYAIEKMPDEMRKEAMRK